MNLSSSLRSFFLIASAIIALTAAASAQIEVAPTRVMLNMRERSREVNVTNTTDNPMEVDVRLGFKVITTDSNGVQGLDSIGTPEQQARSCRDWLKVFPRRFTLPPRGSRVVRVMATIPDGVPEGEYWGRLMVAGVPTAGSVPVDGDTAGGIQTNLMMRLELDFPVIVRKGIVTTGIEFQGLQARRESDGTKGLLDMRRTGNSAYRGTLTAVLRSADGRELARLEDQFTVEFQLRKTLQLPPLTEGNYLLEVESRSIKKGSANDAVIMAETVRKDYALAVGPSGVAVMIRD